MKLNMKITENHCLPDIVANGALPIGLDYEGVTLQKLN